MSKRGPALAVAHRGAAKRMRGAGGGSAGGGGGSRGGGASVGESAEDAALDAAAGAAMTLCDTLAAIMSCRARFPATMAVPRRAAGAPGSHGSVYVPAAPVPLVLTTQLYDILGDRTLVDQELARLQSDNVVRALRLPSGAHDVAFALTSDVRDMLGRIRGGDASSSGDVERAAAVVLAAVDRVRDMAVNEAELAASAAAAAAAAGGGSAGGVEDNNVDNVSRLLLSTGHIVHVPEAACRGIYLFSLPNFGAFLRALEAGRREISTLLRRRMHHDMLLRELELRPLRAASRLGVVFHIRDLVGGGVARRVDTPAGVMLRLCN